MTYTVIRSSRRTLAAEITRDAEVIIRAPRFVSQREIQAFVEKHSEWISTHLTKRLQSIEAHPEPNADEAAVLKSRAAAEIPPRVKYYAELMSLSPAAVTITSARTRFGSCSANNRLCFSWRLMQYPQEAIDYVIVHELAHIVHKNHSQRFYDLIAQHLPDWKERRNLLKE